MSAVGRPPVADEHIEAELERILARPEFDNEAGPVAKFLEWLGELLPDMGEGFFSGIADVMQWVLVVAVAVFLAYLVVGAVRAARDRAAAGTGRAGERGSAAVLERVAALRRAADEARVAGDLVRALRLNFWALVVGLGRRGDLEYRDTWTNRELLERGAPREDVRALLGPLVDELDAKGFGHAPTSAADVDRIEALCDRWLESAA